MGSEQDPGYDKVSPETRAFEKDDDETVREAEAGRGPTPGEEDAAERAEPVSDATREAYQDMVDKGAHVEGEGRI
ncbi:MAG TPA: hypothetical protein VFY82_11010 [Acidimicrobiales bacterium]|nr:hypothetical protein [Acidimicrobiales bacterium]